MSIGPSQARQNYRRWRKFIPVQCLFVFHIYSALCVLLGYVIRFTVSATAFGFASPYLLLRVPNGLAHLYMIHWLYYAASVTLPHIFSSPVK